MKQFPIRRIAILYLGLFWIACIVPAKQEPFRPKVGEFPPLEKAHSYKGELTFVDHANRRGSIRIDGDGRFRFAAPSPFAVYASMEMEGFGLPLRLPLPSSPTV